MTRIILLTAILSLTFTPGKTIAQGTQAPVTKQEILAALKQGTQRSSGQGDLAEQIVERGIAFQIDETTLDEFRHAGARTFLLDAIHRAAATKSVAASPTQTPPSQEQPIPESVERVPVSGPERPRLRIPGENSQPQPAKSLEDMTPEERAAELAKLPFLEQARYHALEYSDDLPNFRVIQSVKRYQKGPTSKDWETQDSLEIELTYSAKTGEKYKLLKLNGAATRMDYDQLAGSTSTGEFGAIMSSIFNEASRAEFKETGRENFNGRKSVVYDFLVKKAFSRSELTDRNTGRSVIAGYRGTLWIDLETKRVLRIELSHENIVPGFPITLAESALEYDWVNIAGERYLLPVRAEVLLGRERDRHYSRNVIEFKQYQKFETDLKLLPDNN